MPPTVSQPASERDWPGELSELDEPSELGETEQGGAAEASRHSATHDDTDVADIPLISEGPSVPRAPVSDSEHSGSGAGSRRPASTLSSRVRRAWAQLGRVPLLPITLCVLCSLGIVQTLFHMGHGIYRSVTWAQEARETRAENEQLQGDIRVLEDAKVQLNSPQYLEQLARCWGYVGRDEQVLVVQSTPVVVGSNCDEYRLP